MPPRFARLFVPFRDARVLHFGDGLLVVDKPTGIPTHGGDESLGGDLVSRLGAWLRGRGTDGYLGVHQRLDLGTSGVMLFTSARDQNARVARAVSERRFARTYVAAVTLRSADFARRLERGPVTLEDALVTEGGLTRVVRHGGVRARARVLLRERQGTRALLELSPETGKTHQLRVQLAHAGAPVAGDRSYGGDRAPRLGLHALELDLAGERRFSAPLPSTLATWVRGETPGLGSQVELSARLEDACVLRTPLAGVADAFRLANDAGDELPGVTLDRYGDFVVLSASSAEAVERAPELARLLVGHGARGVYLVVRARGGAARSGVDERSAPIAGEPAPERLVVSEHGMKLVVELGRGLSTGLFVDQRDNRRRIRELARGARLLNLFAYTSSFGVAAALGGAVEVVSVDVSRRVLERARENFRVNGLEPERHRFDAADALRWLERAARRGERYELVVLDPPSFSSEAGGAAFSVREHYAVAATRALAVLAPGGRLLAVTNHRKTTLARLRRTLREAAAQAGRRVKQLKDLPTGLDCPEGPDGPLPSKSVLLTSE